MVRGALRAPNEYDFYNTYYGGALDSAASTALKPERSVAEELGYRYSQGGVVGAILIGFGRAMGETIAVALVIGDSVEVSSHLFYSGHSIAAIIALQFGEATGGEFRSALIGLGLFLFVLTILVNLVARWFVERSARRARGE